MDHAYRRGELLRHLSFRAKIDAISFRAAEEPVVTKTHFTRPVYGVFGLHDPVRYQLAHPELRDRPLVRAEIAVDIGPDRATMPRVAADGELWAMLMRQTFLFMAENLYPWEGPGVGAGPARAYDGRRTIFLDMNRPTPASTVYFGHDGDPAMVTLYHKVTDGRTRLRRLDERVRVELVLEEAGCHLLGLRVVGDLLSFPYRPALAPYFNAIRPRARARLFKKAPPALRKLLIARVGPEWMQAVGDRYSAGGGVHALLGVNAADTGKNARYQALNREMRKALANVLRIRS
jgi:hypothetical protein